MRIIDLQKELILAIYDVICDIEIKGSVASAVNANALAINEKFQRLVSSLEGYVDQRIIAPCDVDISAIPTLSAVVTILLVDSILGIPSVRKAYNFTLCKMRIFREFPNRIYAILYPLGCRNIRHYAQQQ